MIENNNSSVQIILQSVEDTVKAMSGTMAQHVQAMLPPEALAALPAGQLERMVRLQADFSNKVMALLKDSMEIFLRTSYSEEELEQYAQMVQSPIYQKVMAESPAMMAGLLQTNMVELQKLGEEFAKELIEGLDDE